MEGVEIQLAEVRFEQMSLQGDFTCSGWLNVSNFTRQRTPDRRSFKFQTEGASNSRQKELQIQTSAQTDLPIVQCYLE